MKQSEVLARKRALMIRMQTEGAEAAYGAALGVCLDKTAPAPAKATCSATILRAAGYFNARQDITPKEPHEMSGEELEERIAELRSLGARDVDGDSTPDGQGGVFD